MPVGFAVGAVAALGAGAMAADASKDAARTQARAAGNSSQVQREMFDISRGQQQPFMESGYGSMSELNRLMGISPQTAQGNEPGTLEGDAAQNWGPDTGRQIGDAWLPPDVKLTDHGKGWYTVTTADGQRLGTLRPGGPAGRFIHDGAPVPTPASMASAGSPSGIDANSGYRMDPNGSISRAVQLGGAGSPAGAPAQGMPQSGGTGLPTGYLSQTFGPQQFMAGMDPGYQWRLQQGAQGVMNQAAAGSGSLSGPALKALMEYNQGSASQEFGAGFDRFQTQQGNIFQRLSSIAALGQNAAAGVGNQAVTTGGNIGANIVGAGNAAAAGQIGAANAIGGAAGDVGSLAMLYGMQRGGG